MPESKRCRSDQKCEIWPRLATPQPQHHLTQVPRDVICFYQGGSSSTWARIRIANQLVKVTLCFHFHPRLALPPLTPQVPARRARAWLETSAGLFAHTLLKLLFSISLAGQLQVQPSGLSSGLVTWVSLVCHGGALLVMITKYILFFFLFFFFQGGVVFFFFHRLLFFGLVSGKFHFTNCQSHCVGMCGLLVQFCWYRMPAGL